MTIMPPLLTAILKASTVCSKDLLLGILTRASCARADVAARLANTAVSNTARRAKPNFFISFLPFVFQFVVHRSSLLRVHSPATIHGSRMRYSRQDRPVRAV